MFANGDFWFILMIVFMAGFFLGFWLRGKSLGKPPKKSDSHYTVIDPKLPNTRVDDGGIKYRPVDRPEIKIDPQPTIDQNDPPFPKADSGLFGGRGQPGTRKWPPIFGDEEQDK